MYPEFLIICEIQVSREVRYSTVYVCHICFMCQRLFLYVSSITMLIFLTLFYPLILCVLMWLLLDICNDCHIIGTQCRLSVWIRFVSQGYKLDFTISVTSREDGRCLLVGWPQLLICCHILHQVSAVCTCTTLETL